MTQVLKAPARATARRGSDPDVVDIVSSVIADVRADGDDAVRRYSQKFDQWSPPSFRLSDAEIADVVASVPDTVLDDLRFAQTQVRNFARAQRDSIRDFEMETLPGVFLGQRNVPVAASGA